MPKKTYTSGLDGRRRDASGEIRRKSGNTRVGSLRKEYGPDFAKGYRSDVMLRTLLENTGSKSLADYLKHSKRGKRLSATAGSSDISNTIFSRTTVIFEPALKNLAKK